MKTNRIVPWTVLVLLTVFAWGCGSSRDSGTSVAGDANTLASAEPVGISNCLTCHNPATSLVQEWMLSRHGNHLLSTTKLANDTETPGNDPSPGSCAFLCHDPYDDRNDIDYAYVATFEDPTKTNWGTANPTSFVSCEACHGGGQFHNGIASGIPFPAPSTRQCAQCHYLSDELGKPEWVALGEYPHHDGSSGGNNVRRNIFDSHIDNPATTNIIEGYVVKTDGVGGCNGCHIAHDFNLTINYQWGNSPHGGHIKAVKDAVLAAGAVDATTLLANVTAAGVDSTTGDAWLHYDWDASNLASCQRCHTATGLMNFMADTANYSSAGNDFSHLVGWTPASSSGQNEMLYCWGCHADTQTGEVRDDANGITLDFIYEDPDVTAGTPEIITLPDKGQSNICGACHAGRGNNTSIRTGRRSTRFAGHHAPTAGSLYAATTHTGFEYEDALGVVLDYTAISAQHLNIGGTADGPCVSCHMAGTADHTFRATTEDAGGNITAITNQTLCNSCHDGVITATIDVPTLTGYKTNFEDARLILTNLVKNVVTNDYNLDLTADDPSTTAPDAYAMNTLLVDLNGYGAFQNYLYMNEEPCIYVHNTLYGRRLIFDSIDWLEDGALNGTIVDYSATNAAGMAWIGGTTRP